MFKMTSKGCCLQPVLFVVVVVCVLGIQHSNAGMYHESCEAKCRQHCISLSQNYYSEAFLMNQFQNCVKNCVTGRDVWIPSVTMTPPLFKTRPPYAVTTHHPRTRGPVYPGWSRRPPYTYRPPPNTGVVTFVPPYTQRPPYTLRPPFTTTPFAPRVTTTRPKTRKPIQYGCGVTRNFASRIIGGTPADRCEFPWMVGVEVYTFFCGGTIIDRRHIMTAAHCLKNVLPGRSGVAPTSAVNVRYGSSKRSQMNTIGVAKIHVNSRYGNFKSEYDVAILTLERDLEFNECVGQMCLPSAGQNPEEMDECVTAGWGTMDATLTSWNKPNTLQKVTLPLVPRDICNRAWNQSNRVTIDDLKLCAGYYGVGGKDACKGDSGGPLMCRKGKGPFTQFGIVSFGRKCAEPEWPGVYTNVAHSEILQYVIASTNDV